MTLRILIAGGGIGGLTAAMALARLGHRVELLEQADVFAEVGAGVQLGPNATRRLASLGLSGAVDGIAARPEALVIASAVTGEGLARLLLGEAMLHRYGAPYCCVHRADLHAVLLDAVQGSDGTEGSEGATLNLKARITRIEASDDAVAIATGDGRVWEGDALVGADGLWSVVRPKVVGDASAPHATGHTAWRGLIDQRTLPQAQRSNDVRVWLGPRLHAVAYPVRRGEALNVVVLAESAPAGDARDWNQASSLEALQRAIGGCCGSLQALMESIPDWRAWTLNDREPLTGPQQMASGRMALLGDAAHPMLPYLAQGAGMAIEDAVALAEALQEILGRSADLPAALARFADARWQRNARVQARARRNAEIFHMTGPMRFGRDLSLRALGPKLLDVPWLYGG
ncbi:FAD-dependent monooxygenase [Variovorax sp. RHLX14]|uniref:FAD-dependent monooxygenase n=1 Tax=Variovorax sp. RHLX14 TaxID=1259731 RepID=UPI003F47C8EB